MQDSTYKQPDNTPGKNTSKKKILIVDDDRVHLEVASEVLQDAQFEVITHTDISSAVPRAKELQPDLLLLDIHMQGVSGDELAALFRADAETCTIPLVFYSSYDEDTLKKLVERAGVQGYICKWNIAELQTLVRKHLHMPGEEND